MELYQAEWCPHSHRVRQRLTESRRRHPSPPGSRRAGRAACARDRNRAAGDPGARRRGRPRRLRRRRDPRLPERPLHRAGRHGRPPCESRARRCRSSRRSPRR